MGENHARRRFLRTLSCLPLLFQTLYQTKALAQKQPQKPLRIGLTPVILDDQLGFLHEWRSWLESRLNRTVVFVQRRKYRDITAALNSGEIDAAWVCGYPYIRNRQTMELLAVPRYKNKLTYTSNIIVNTRKQFESVNSLSDLKDTIFVFSDPDSNSGFLYPQYRFSQLGIKQGSFFKRTFFTWSHRNTIDAVASGLADAGAVDSYILEQYKRHHPNIVAHTRVLEISPAFGFPPLVMRHALPRDEISQLSDVICNMDKDTGGKSLLRQLGLDGFEKGSPDLFSGIEQMYFSLSNNVNSPTIDHASS